MQSQLARLNEQFAIDGVLQFVEGRGGLIAAEIRNTLAQATLYLHGAHLCHWQPKGHQPVLWLSEHSQWSPDAPIRGGIPICWPWFGPHATDSALPAHGPVRQSQWQVQSAGENGAGETRISLSLNAKSVPVEWRSFEFELLYQVTIGEQLGVELVAVNTGSTPMTFTEALHTYLSVADVRQVTIDGLGGARYIDKTRRMHQFVQEQPQICFSEETDRIYQETANTCILHDPGLQRDIIVKKFGSRSTVIWNPWIDKAGNMPDFGNDEWPGMVCIETANAGDQAVSLEPGQRHTITAFVSVEQV